MSRPIRHAVYDKIVARFADYAWHDVSELDEVTSYRQYWLESLRRDPGFEVDEADGRVRLLPVDESGRIAS